MRASVRPGGGKAPATVVEFVLGQGDVVTDLKMLPTMLDRAAGQGMY